MKTELEDILQQSGVKGMKWGKRKAESTSVVKSDKAPSKIKAHVDSIKREHSWNKVLKNANNMSTKDIQKVAARNQLENDMKRLSKKTKVGSSKDKQDYLKRADMTDQELFRKVQRLRAKDNLHRNVGDATKAQKEVAKKIVTVVAPLALQYALTGSIGKRDITNAAINAAVNLGGEKARLAKNVYDQGKQTKKVKHSDVLEDILQHHGVKGMKWGKYTAKVKNAVKSHVKAHRAKQNQKVLDHHEKNKEKKTYKKLYEHNSKRYKTHLQAARKTREQVAAINKQRAIIATKIAVGVAGAQRHNIAKAAKVVSKAATNPDNIRRAKNVVQAVKRSPIRYVDGKAMKNVVKTVL